MGMVVRQIDPANPQELERYYDISFQAFNVNSAPPEVRRAMREQEYAKPEDTQAVFDGQELLAGLVAHNMKMYAGTSVLPMGGIASVACPPEYRRRGATALLLRKTLERMRANGQAVSMLYPFKFVFYRKYGWELGGRRIHYTIPLTELSCFLPAQGCARRATKEQYAQLNRLYDGWASARVGTLARDEEHWQRRILSDSVSKEFKYIYLWYPDQECDEAEGYVIYTIKTDKGRVLQVRELGYVTQRAYEGLWGLLANHDSQADKVEVNLPTDDPLMHIIANPRVEAKLEPTFMFRIVDLIPALQARPFGVTTLNLRLNVTDSQCPWNTGSFQVQIQGGAATVTQCDATGSVEADCAELALDIQALSQLYTGVLTPSQGICLGKISYTGSDTLLPELDKAFANLSGYTNDFF